MGSAYGGQSEESSQDADLSGMQLFVVGAKEQAAEFCGVAGPGEFDRFIEQFLREPGECAEHLLVDAVKHLSEFGWRGIACRIRIRCCATAEAFAEGGGHEVEVTFGASADAEQAEPILSHGEMSELPCEVGAAGGWLCEPGIFGEPVEQCECVIAGEADLGKCEFEHGGGSAVGSGCVGEDFGVVPYPGCGKSSNLLAGNFSAAALGEPWKVGCTKRKSLNTDCSCI